MIWDYIKNSEIRKPIYDHIIDIIRDNNDNNSI